jgi:ABC-type transport system substrate-binding protein
MRGARLVGGIVVVGWRAASGERALRAVAGSILLALVVLLVAGCAAGGSTEAGPASTSSPSATPRPGGIYNYPLQLDPGTLAPFAVIDGYDVARQIFEGLVAYQPLEDGTYVTVPRLAQSWTANEDATVWTFQLRRGVKFQAPVNREVTADDIVADFRFGADVANKSIVAYMYAILTGTDESGHAARPVDLGVETLDRYTVRFTLKQPFAAFPDSLGGAQAWVWPVDYLRRIGRARFERQPVGTGPFVLSRWVRGDHIDLVRNPGWWDGASGRPYLDGVHFQIFQSATAGLLAFQKGLIDYTWVPQGQVAASRSLPQVKSGEWSARNLPRVATAFVGFDMTDPVVGGAQGLPVRQAIDCAIDRGSLVAAVSDSVNIPQTGLVPPILAGWGEGVPAQAYDPARATELYQAAGSPPLSVVCPDERFGKSVADWLRSACAAVDIPLRVRVISWDKYLNQFTTGRFPRMFLMGWVADYPSADNFLYDLYNSEQSPYTSGTSYSDPDVDRLLTMARSTTDPARHYDLNRRAAAEIMTDLPVIPLFEYADYRLLSQRIGGFVADPMGRVDMWKLWVR